MILNMFQLYLGKTFAEYSFFLCSNYQEHFKMCALDHKEL